MATEYDYSSSEEKIKEEVNRTGATFHYNHQIGHFPLSERPEFFYKIFRENN